MIESILEKSIAGQRLEPSEAVELFATKDILLLGNVASRLTRKKLKDNKTITYIVDRNINYTNVCVTDCSFCAFYRNRIKMPMSFHLRPLGKKLRRPWLLVDDKYCCRADTITT